eukprot:3044846-Heterocapsa_arctica.AAC.1
MHSNNLKAAPILAPISPSYRRASSPTGHGPRRRPGSGQRRAAIKHKAAVRQSEVGGARQASTLPF